ncbi:hypothetical protein FHG87_022083 [Trinorchestia longiramus]|nr:hypothetical protein FHG87_022083 [Trinorchestia longiramus]
MPETSVRRLNEKCCSEEDTGMQQRPEAVWRNVDASANAKTWSNELNTPEERTKIKEDKIKRMFARMNKQGLVQQPYWPVTAAATAAAATAAAATATGATTAIATGGRRQEAARSRSRQHKYCTADIIAGTADSTADSTTDSTAGTADSTTDSTHTQRRAPIIA